MKKVDIDLNAINQYVSNLDNIDLGPFISIQKMKGGRSNPNYLIATKNSRYVLRRQPFGKLLKSAHNVSREYQVLNALKHTIIPVPEVVHLCTDQSVIGVHFYIMRFVQGQISTLFHLPQLDDKGRGARYNNMIDLLADLHNLDYISLGLTGFGHPGNYFERQYARWNKAFQLSLPDAIPSFTQLSVWIATHLPKGGRTSLIHGDYRLDNMIFDPESSAITALLDWELSTLGDPLSDLGYFLGVLNTPSDFVFPGFLNFDRTCIGIPSEEEMLERYCEHTNRKSIDNWPFYKAFGFFRLSAICAGIQARVIQGNAVDETSQLFGSLTGKIAELGLKQLE